MANLASVPKKISAGRPREHRLKLTVTVKRTTKRSIDSMVDKEDRERSTRGRILDTVMELHKQAVQTSVD